MDLPPPFFSLSSFPPQITLFFPLSHISHPAIKSRSPSHEISPTLRGAQDFKRGLYRTRLSILPPLCNMLPFHLIVLHLSLPLAVFTVLVFCFAFFACVLTLTHPLPLPALIPFLLFSLLLCPSSPLSLLVLFYLC